MISPLPTVFHCTLLDRETSRDDCHCCDLGAVCAGIPSRLMLINRPAPVGPASWPQYPPPFRGSAKVRVSGQRETRRSGSGAKGRDFFLGSSSASKYSPPRPAPQARRGE